MEFFLENWQSILAVVLVCLDVILTFVRTGQVKRQVDGLVNTSSFTSYSETFSQQRIAQLEQRVFELEALLKQAINEVNNG